MSHCGLHTLTVPATWNLMASFPICGFFIVCFCIFKPLALRHSFVYLTDLLFTDDDSIPDLLGRVLVYVIITVLLEIFSPPFYLN